MTVWIVYFKVYKTPDPRLLLVESWHENEKSASIRAKELGGAYTIKQVLVLNMGANECKQPSPSSSAAADDLLSNKPSNP